jgi:hypothetical protein
MTHKLSTEHEIMAAQLAATAAAFQVLVSCLQENGALKHGEFQDALRLFIRTAPASASPAMLLLDDLRKALVACDARRSNS